MINKASLTACLYSTNVSNNKGLMTILSLFFSKFVALKK